MTADLAQGRILITGANGFIGSAVTRRLVGNGFAVTGAVRRPELADLPSDTVGVADLSAATDWSGALRGAAVVIHTAARVHVMRETSGDPLAEFRRVNVAGSLSLARQAAHAGVRRFIFLSSIKVNGEETVAGRPFTADQAPDPLDAYGTSKLEAEAGLKEIAAASGMQVVIIRPPLVYGPGVKANFFSLMKWVYEGIPLPFGSATHNRRSFVALDNLVDLIATCVWHEQAGNQIFLVSDDEDLSTAGLLRRIAAALGRPARLILCPPSLLMSLARLGGRSDVARRLLGSLQVDIEKTRAVLGWSPPVTVDAALAETARHFIGQFRP